ncbi:MAG TPA: quinone oxidoreductase [Solirubrobacteraceae bacterium]|nr:quinone oxidoreductase [Solirubrobacteraceae bacterium]
MRAITFERNGGPEVLEAREVDDPRPADGEVLVRVEAAGVNFRDIYQREGGGYAAQAPPAVMGVEGAGTIEGSGERVAWTNVAGSYAELVAAPAERLVPLPDDVSSEIGAAALLQGLTAHYLANDSYPIVPGDWVIVHAAAGGVGLLLTQLAKLRGGRVIATTSTADKGELARGAGADEVIGYEGFAARARELAGGEGVAAVYDGIGASTFYEGLTALRPTGRMILYGSASGQPEPLAPALLASSGSLYLQRPTLHSYTRTPEELRERSAALFALIAQGRLDVRIGGRYPLEQARQAQEDLASRATSGKLLLIP